MPSYKFNDHLARVHKNPESAVRFNEENHHLDTAINLMKTKECAPVRPERIQAEKHTTG